MHILHPWIFPRKSSMSWGSECHQNISKPQNVRLIRGSLNYGRGSTNISIFQEWLIDRTTQNKQNRNSTVNVWNMTCIRMNQGLKLNFSWSNLTSSRGFSVFVLFTSWIHWIQCPKLFDNWNPFVLTIPFLICHIFHLHSVPWKDRWGFRKITLFWSINTFAVAKLEKCSYEKWLIFQALASPKTNWNFPAWKFIRVLAHLELLGPAWYIFVTKLAVKHFLTLTCLIVVWNDFTHKSPMRSVEVVNFQPVCNMANHLEAKFRSWKVGIRFLDLHWKSHKTFYSLEANGTKHHHHSVGHLTSSFWNLSRVASISLVSICDKSIQIPETCLTPPKQWFQLPTLTCGESQHVLLGTSAPTLARMTKGWMSNHIPQLVVGILVNPPLKNISTSVGLRKAFQKKRVGGKWLEPWKSYEFVSSDRKTAAWTISFSAKRAAVSLCRLFLCSRWNLPLRCWQSQMKLKVSWIGSFHMLSSLYSMSFQWCVSLPFGHVRCLLANWA